MRNVHLRDIKGTLLRSLKHKEGSWKYNYAENWKQKEKLSSSRWTKLKRVMAKQPLLISAQVFEKSGIVGVKKEKRWRIFSELGYVKKSPGQPSLLKANILKRQN